MAVVGTVEAILKLNDQFSRELRKVVKDFDSGTKKIERGGNSIAASLSKAGAAIGVAFGTREMARLGASSFKLAADFDLNLTKVVNLVGLSRDQVNGLRADVIRLSHDTGKPLLELSDALYYVTSAGIRDSALAMEALTASAKGAAIGLGTTSAVANIVTSVMNAYGQSTTKASDAANTLLLAVRAGKFEAAALAPVMGRVVSVAASMSVSFKEVATAMAVMSRTGLEAYEASTSLSALFSGLLGGGEKASKAVQAIGLSLEKLREVAAGPEGIIGMLKMLDEQVVKFADDSKELVLLREIFPNIRALRMVLNVLSQLNQEGSNVQWIVDEIKKGTDELGKAMDELRTRPGYKYQQFLADLTITKLELGDKIVPLALGLFKLGERLLNLANTLINARDSFERLADAIKDAAPAIGWLVDDVVALTDKFHLLIRATPVGILLWLDSLATKSQEASDKFIAGATAISSAVAEMHSRVFRAVLDDDKESLKLLEKTLSSAIEDTKTKVAKLRSQLAASKISRTPGDDRSQLTAAQFNLTREIASGNAVLAKNEELLGRVKKQLEDTTAAERAASEGLREKSIAQKKVLNDSQKALVVQAELQRNLAVQISRFGAGSVEVKAYEMAIKEAGDAVANLNAEGLSLLLNSLFPYTKALAGAQLNVEALTEAQKNQQEELDSLNELYANTEGTARLAELTELYGHASDEVAKLKGELQKAGEQAKNTDPILAQFAKEAAEAFGVANLWLTNATDASKQFEREGEKVAEVWRRAYGQMDLLPLIEDFGTLSEEVEIHLRSVQALKDIDDPFHRQEIIRAVTATVKFERAIEKVAEAQAIIRGLIDDIAKSFADMIVSGEFTADNIKDVFVDAFKDMASEMLESWIKTLAEVLARWIATRTKMKAFDVAMSGSNNGGGGGLFSSLVGGLGKLFGGGGGGSAASTGIYGPTQSGGNIASGSSGAAGSALALGAIAVILGTWYHGWKKEKQQKADREDPSGIGGINAGFSTPGLTGSPGFEGKGMGIYKQILIGIAEFEKQLGLSLSFFPNIAVQAKDGGKKFELSIHNTVVGVFDSLDAAIQAGIAIAATEAEGAFGENVKAILGQGLDLTSSQFEELLTYAKQLDALGIPASARETYFGFAELVTQLGRSRDMADLLGLNADDAFELALESTLLFKAGVEDTLKGIIGSGSGIAQQTLNAVAAARAINAAADAQVSAVQAVADATVVAATQTVQTAMTAEEAAAAAAARIAAIGARLDSAGQGAIQTVSDAGDAVVEIAELVGDAAIGLGDQLHISEDLINEALAAADRDLQIALLEKLAVNEQELMLLQELKFRQELANIHAIYAELLLLGQLTAQQIAMFEGMLSRFEAQGAVAWGGGRPGRRPRPSEPSGPTLEDEIADLQDAIDGLIYDAMSPLQQQLYDLNTTFDELQATAARLGYGEEELAELRKQAMQRLLDAAKAAITDSDLLRQFLGPNMIEGGQFGMSDFERQAADIRAAFDELRAANQALLDETGERAITFWQLNLAELRALQALAEQVIDGFGLPLEQTRDRIKAMTDALDFLQQMMDEGALSAGRFAEVFGELALQAEAELLGLFATMLDQIGMTDEAAQLRAALDRINFEIARIQLNMLYLAFVALGYIADQLKTDLDVLLGVINNWEWPDAPTTGDDGPLTVKPYDPSKDATAIAKDLAKDVRDKLREWLESGLGPLLKAAKDLNRELAEVTEKAIAARVPLSEVAEAFAVMRQTFIDEALSEFKYAGESPLERQFREIGERFKDIRDAFLEIGASAEQMAELGLAEQTAWEALWAEAHAGINALIDDLTAGPLSGRGTRAQFEAAWAALQEQFAQAAGGDLGALGGFDTAASALIDLLDQVFGHGAAGGALREEILAMLQELASMGGVGTVAGDDPLPDVVRWAADNSDNVVRDEGQQLRTMLGNIESRQEERDFMVVNELRMIRLNGQQNTVFTR